MMRAWIFNIGDEITAGRVVNTNASFLAGELDRAGITVEKIIAVADDEPAIIAEIKAFLASGSALLVTTGGLGATDDDITRRAVAAALNKKLASGASADLFPEGASPIENRYGSADGFLISHEGKTIISLVGPPYEMRPMFKDVFARLYSGAKKKEDVREFTVIGGTEADFDKILRPLRAEFPGVSLNSYCSVGKIRYVLKGAGDEFAKFVERFAGLLSENIIGVGDISIEEAVVSRLKERKYKVSFAESCTGGLLAAKIVSVPGASSILGESFVVYSNEAKMKYLGVKSETLAAHGAVSEETVREMVDGLERIGAGDALVSASGIAGPEGGSREKPVGLVYCAVKIGGVTRVGKRVFKGDRNLIRERAACWVLGKLWTYLKG
ncbi:MAG: nicotinamide-nucleotide amidohydrolase family protein [Bacilli bacterium]|jgi:nicotinamide-nucleotide amidase